LRFLERIEIFGINDKDPVSVPTALVKMFIMFSPKFGTQDTIDVEVGILEHMKWAILLGNEIFEGTDLTDVICVEGHRDPSMTDGRRQLTTWPQSTQIPYRYQT